MSSSQDNSHLIISGNCPGKRRRTALKEGAAPRTTGEANWLEALHVHGTGAETHQTSRKPSLHPRDDAAQPTRSRPQARSEQRDERRRSPVPRKDLGNPFKRAKTEQRGRPARSPMPQQYMGNPFDQARAERRQQEARLGITPVSDFEAAGVHVRDLLMSGDTRSLIDGGVPVAGLYEAGVSATALLKAGVSAAELVEIGVPAAELLKAGISDLQLREAVDLVNSLSGLSTMYRSGFQQRHDEEERQAPEPAGNITGETNSMAIKTETDEADSTSIKKETDEAGSILTALRSVVVKIVDVFSTFAA